MPQASPPNSISIVLRRINRELGGNFKLDAFEHHAFYNRERKRIEMHLASRIRQKVTVAGSTFDFRAGETIHTENSYKYSRDSFARAGARGGLDDAVELDRCQRQFRGLRAGLAVVLLSACERPGSGLIRKAWRSQSERLNRPPGHKGPSSFQSGFPPHEDRWFRARQTIASRRRRRRPGDRPPGRRSENPRRSRSRFWRAPAAICPPSPMPPRRLPPRRAVRSTGSSTPCRWPIRARSSASA